MRVLADGRVRRSEAEWRKLLERFEASGLSASAFCRREKITRSALTQWRNRLKKGGGPRVGEFVEIPLGRKPATAGLSSGELELSLPGGVTLRWKP